MSHPHDVPSSIDLRLPAEARRWADAAMVKRPWREQLFQRIVQELPKGTPQSWSLGRDQASLASEC
jgi:hypothetical protein